MSGVMILVGAGVALAMVALAMVALHRLNASMTACNLAALARTQEYPAAIAYGTAHAPAMCATGHSTRPFADDYLLRHYVDRGRDGPLVDTQWREYAATTPHFSRGISTTRHYKRNRLGPGGGTGAVEITHTTPHRKPDAGSDLLVPLGQAVASAIIAALLVGVLAAVAGRGDTLRVVGVVFVGVLAVAWLWRLGVVDSLLSVVERITQELDDDDSEEVDPAHAMTINASAARSDAGKRERSSERALRLADLLAFAGRCATVGCAERAQGIRPGTPAQETYKAKRDLLISLGIGRWKNADNHNLGWGLTVNPAEAAEILRRHVMDVSST